MDYSNPGFEFGSEDPNPDFYPTLVVHNKHGSRNRANTICPTNWGKLFEKAKILQKTENAVELRYGS
jgi:hypothetical protein